MIPEDKIFWHNIHRLCNSSNVSHVDKCLIKGYHRLFMKHQDEQALYITDDDYKIALLYDQQMAFKALRLFSSSTHFPRKTNKQIIYLIFISDACFELLDTRHFKKIDCELLIKLACQQVKYGFCTENTETIDHLSEDDENPIRVNIIVDKTNIKIDEQIRNVDQPFIDTRSCKTPTDVWREIGSGNSFQKYRLKVI